MDINKKLLEAASKVYSAMQGMDKFVDANFPQEIVGIVKRHSKIAVASAWIPIPGADVAAGAANIWTMYVLINKKVGISVGDNILKTIGAGVATNLASAAAVSTVASALKFIPGIGSLAGAALMSGTLYAVTLASGWVYLMALSYMLQNKGKNFSANDLQQAVNKVLKESTFLKDFISSAKKSYKS